MPKRRSNQSDGVPRSPSGPALIEYMKRERGRAFPLLDRIQKKYPNDIKRQVQEFLKEFDIPAGTGRQKTDSGKPREVSEETSDTYFAIFHWIVDALRAPELGMGIRNMTEFSGKHVRHLLKYMHARGTSPSRMQQVIGKARRWCVWIGKADAVPAMEVLVAECGLPKGTGRRKYGATKPRTLRSKGIDFNGVLARASHRCALTELHLAMQIMFGCRVKETSFMDPAKSDEGTHLHIYRGAKGGHERRVPIRTAEQRAWLERAKAYAATAPKKLLVRRPMPQWPQAKNHFYYVAGKIGLTAQGEYQTTPHGLRHEYLCRRYEELAGALPPVEGGVPVDPETHRAASETVIREAGHHDPGKIQAYNGNYNEAVRAANRAVKSLYARMTDPRVISELRELGLTGLLLVGDAADGVIKAEAITVCAYETETSDEALEFVTENLETLRTLLQVLIGTRVELARRTPAHLAAKHTLEITIPKE